MPTAQRTRESTRNFAEATGPARQFLTFRLGREEYGIDILKVQEIRGWERPTKLANAPEFIKGVINLRGTIVPIVDMRIRFGLGEATYDALTVVIVLNLAGRVVGMVVDSVSDVIALAADCIQPPPEFSAGADMKYVTGLGTAEDRMLILVDIENLMASAEMALVSDPIH